jgi:hypothetical protein
MLFIKNYPTQLGHTLLRLAASQPVCALAFPLAWLPILASQHNEEVARRF